MAQRIKEETFRQVQFDCQAVNSEEGLPFRKLLSSRLVATNLEKAQVKYRARVFGPEITLLAFLSQAVANGDEASCEAAVGRVFRDRVLAGQSACSLDSSSYCQARARLPEEVVAELVRETGQELHRKAPEEWLWKGRRVILADGSTATLDDTEENQAAYPQSSNQKAGLGFPMVRFVVFLSLPVGTVLECAMGPCRGKQTGEQSLFRTMWQAFVAGDIVLADRLYDCYRDIVLLKERGVDSLFGKKQSRRCDFRKGRRLGPDDHLVIWKKPEYDSSRFESREEWKSLPETLEMREVRLRVRRRGYKTRKVVIVTTLVDAEKYSKQDLTDLFAQRWHCELDLRSIKQALGLHHIRCKSPDMARKALWVHLLAYNLIRVRMAQAAQQHAEMPRQLSFTSAKNLIATFSDDLRRTSGAEHQRIEAKLLQAIASRRVGNRPGRKEPRAVKKRQQKYSRLTKPRSLARKGLPA